MIQMWKKNLLGYSDQMALSFLRTCVSKEWVHIVDTSDNLDECLKTFALYSSNKELYLRTTMEAMRVHPKSRPYIYDKTMLNFFEKSIVKISRLNSAYLLDFATAQQLVNKLSDITLRRQFTNELTELRDSTSDTHTVNNYLSTKKQIIHKARIAIDNNLDVDEIDQTSTRDSGRGIFSASTYTVQTNNREQRGYKGSRFQKGENQQHYRDNKRSYDHINNNRPTNMDSRGDLRYDWKGNPIDITDNQRKRRNFENAKGQSHASALYTQGSRDNHSDQDRGQVSQRGNSFKGRYPRGSRQRQPQGKKRGYSPQGFSPDQSYFNSLQCKICNKKGHDSLFYCSKFTEFIPRGTNVKSLPKEVCTKCLSIGQPQCTHKALRGYQTYLCKKSNDNFLICNQCPHHRVAQDWMKSNFNPQDGKKNLSKLLHSFPNYSATINSLQVVLDQSDTS